MTKKLYDTDAYIKEFTAEVISCTEKENGYAVILNQTAFFPEGGGQSSDTGELNNIQVTDVQLVNGEIIHYTCQKISAGTTVTGNINWEARYRKMQNHSGEHIVSGTIHKLFGFNNVGFHIGSEGVTIDIDGELTREDLLKIEMISNTAVTENLKITADYPSDEILASLDYRSKIEITDEIRIVTIGNYDCCACCAPHVAQTGEIGIIKLLDMIRYKGGVRIKMLCGYDALDDYNCKFKNISEIAVMLSAKQSETAMAVKRILNELEEEKKAKSQLRRELLSIKAEMIEETSANICIFEEKCDTDDLRIILNAAVKKCTGSICAAFSGNDSTGYRYVMVSSKGSLREYSKDINTALSGKGGGAAMIQGTAKARRTDIEKYIEGFRYKI